MIKECWEKCSGKKSGGLVPYKDIAIMENIKLKTPTFYYMEEYKEFKFIILSIRKEVIENGRSIK